MRLDLLFPRLPPALDGIGDYTANLASALCEAGVSARVLTAEANALPINGVEVVEAFHLRNRGGILEALKPITSNPPDWLVLQFNQFSYGRWGLNPFVPYLLYSIKRHVPQTRVAVMFHEDFLPANTWRNAIMTTWQRAQFFALGALADHVFFSIEPWLMQYQSWWPGTPVYHLPVGSNILFVETDRAEMRADLGIGDETFVMGVFGSLHASRLIGHIRAAADAVFKQTDDALLLYIGPHGDEFIAEMNGLRVFNAGRLSAEGVSQYFQAMDVHLAPFMDGVSTRRGSFMTGMQHGVATITTTGLQTGAKLSAMCGNAYVAAPEDDVSAFVAHVLKLRHSESDRVHIAAMGRQRYLQQFDWNVVARRVMDTLQTQQEPL